MIPKDNVCNSVFFFPGIDFWHMLCLFLIETSFALPRLDRRSPSLIFDLPLIVGNFYSFFYIAFLKVFSHAPSLWFLSFSPLLIVGLFFLAFLLSIDSISVFKISLICPQCWVWSYSGFLLKRNVISSSNGDCKGYISLKSEGMNKDDIFSFQARSIRTDKFWSRLV